MRTHIVSELACHQPTTPTRFIPCVFGHLRIAANSKNHERKLNEIVLKTVIGFWCWRSVWSRQLWQRPLSFWRVIHRKVSLEPCIQKKIDHFCSNIIHIVKELPSNETILTFFKFRVSAAATTSKHCTPTTCRFHLKLNIYFFPNPWETSVTSGDINPWLLVQTNQYQIKHTAGSSISRGKVSLKSKIQLQNHGKCQGSLFQRKAPRVMQGLNIKIIPFASLNSFEDLWFDH